MSEALYRKYRPQIFEDVVGQEHIERTIKNAIGQDKVSHAYLFCGPRGTGKTTTARLLAKALLCERGPTADPDGTCEDCVAIANGEHPDVYELDAASRTGVDNVREEIIGRVQFAPTRGRYKVYIIDEVHMLSTAAFNALLKTLEEPPSHVVFILATTDPQKVPETIHSRCQRFDFRRISAEAIVSRLGAVCVAEGVEFEGEALDLIAHRAEGGMRNALTSLEQLIAFGEGAVTLETAERLLGALDSSDLAAIVHAIGTRDVAACFRWTAEYVETGADLAQFVRDLAEHVRNMYVLALAGDDVALEVSESTRRELAAELPLFGPDRLARLLGVLGDLSAELKTSTNPRLSFEIALTRMVRPDSDLTLESLVERVEALEKGYSAAAPVSSVVLSNDGTADAAAFPSTRSRGDAAGSRASASPKGTSFGARVASAIPTISGTGETPADIGEPASEQSQPVPVAFTGAQPVVNARAPQVDATTPEGTSAGERMRNASGAREFADVGGAVGGAASGIAGAVADTSATGGAAGDSSTEISSSGATAGVQSGSVAGARAPSAGLVASLQNPAALQRMWQAALTTLKKNKAAYGVLFLNTKAVYQSGRSDIVVEFPAENTFAFKAVQKPDVQDALAEALRQACGEPLAFELVQVGTSGQFSASAASASFQTAAQPAGQAFATDGVHPEVQQASPFEARQVARSDTQPIGQAFATEARQVERTEMQPTATQAAAAQPARQAAQPEAHPMVQRPVRCEARPADSSSAPSEGLVSPQRVAPSAEVRNDVPPYDDEPPYDDAPPYDDEPFEYENQGQVSLPPEPVDAATSATQTPASDGFGESAETPAGLEALLTSSFGDGVVVEEVRE